MEQTNRSNKEETKGMILQTTVPETGNRSHDISVIDPLTASLPSTFYKHLTYLFTYRYHVFIR